MTPRERLRKRRELALEAEEQLLAELRERDELQSLSGQPLDLSDDSPSWFMNRLLRREGMSHPLLERGRDVDEALEELWKILEPVRRWWDRIVAGRQWTAAEAATFNLRRSQALADIRERIPRVNALIRDHNLVVPDALHRRPMPVEETMRRLAEDIPELESAVPLTPSPRRGWPAILLRATFRKRG
jgi:hypothetical protein